MNNDNILLEWHDPADGGLRCRDVEGGDVRQTRPRMTRTCGTRRGIHTVVVNKPEPDCILIGRSRLATLQFGIPRMNWSRYYVCEPGEHVSVPNRMEGMPMRGVLRLLTYILAYYGRAKSRSSRRMPA